MKRKKLLSTAVAGALVAAQMVMPVMADGGSFNVELTTKTGVLRVEVPTSMAIAVDQFMITTPGTQIASSAFTMTNKSEMDVKVAVTSTVTLGTGINLVSTATAAENSTGHEAWLGIAAMTADGAYDDSDTSDTETLGDLTDTNANVTSFASDTKKAEQTFYLEKSAGNAEYNLALPDATTGKVADEERTYAKFYELTPITFTGADDTAKGTELQAKVDEGDVYAVVSANVGKDGETVTKLAKGSTAAYANTNNYYTAAEDGVELSALETGNNKLYVYGTMDADGGKAGFTYIGKLSGAKETWTKTDISDINVAYTIAGVTADRYAEVVNDCTYGLYQEPNSAPSIASTDKTQTLAADTAATIPVDLGAGELGATGVSKIVPKAVPAYDLLSNNLVTYSNGTITVPETTVNAMLAAPNTYFVDGECVLVITFDDDASTTEEVTLEAPTTP